MVDVVAIFVSLEEVNKLLDALFDEVVDVAFAEASGYGYCVARDFTIEALSVFV